MVKNNFTKEYKEITEELKRRHQGGNRGCFEIFSESGKDADLIWGCCGIKELLQVNDKQIDFVVAGHKTFCWYDDNHSRWANDQAQAIIEEVAITGADEDGWYSAFEKEISIIPSLFHGKISIKRTVQKIITAYRKTIKPFTDEWCAIEDELLRLERAETLRNKTKKRLTVVK